MELSRLDRHSIELVARAQQVIPAPRTAAPDDVARPFFLREFRNAHKRSPVVIGLLTALLVAQSGCSALSRKLREDERIFALEAAQSRIERGECALALEFLDRAQARLDLGDYAGASTLARARCYEKLGQARLARSHRRLVDDFYTTEPMAFPNADGSSVFRLADLDPDDYRAHPSWLEIPPPRYSSNASRSKVIGRVIVAFEIPTTAGPKNIRILEMPHPLLATWAIEAVARGRIQPGLKPDLTTPHRYIATFSFESRWVTKGSAGPTSPTGLRITD